MLTWLTCGTKTRSSKSNEDTDLIEETPPQSGSPQGKETVPTETRPTRISRSTSLPTNSEAKESDVGLHEKKQVTRNLQSKWLSNFRWAVTFVLNERCTKNRFERGIFM